MGQVVDNKYYEVVAPKSFSEKILIKARDNIYDDFLRLCRPGEQSKILDVGVSDVLSDGANVLERRFPHQQNITACGIGDASEFQREFPQIAYVQIEAGQPLPFADGQFDIVAANAVLEHVGSPQAQKFFVSELSRVGKAVFITVPHRYFPVEHHTAIPFLHWWDGSFAASCRALGKDKWAQSENLILMNRARLVSALGSGADWQVGHTGLRLGILSSNLYAFRPVRSSR